MMAAISDNAQSPNTVPPLATLWVDGPLPKLELTCLLHMVLRNIKVTLFTYGKIPNAPSEIEVQDARDIYDYSGLVAGKSSAQKLEFSMVADIFRLHMLKRGIAYWLDADFLPTGNRFPSLNGAFYGREGQTIANSALFLSKDEPLLDEYLDIVTQYDLVRRPYYSPRIRNEIRVRKKFGRPKMHCTEIPAMRFSGPSVLGYLLEKYQKLSNAFPSEWFYPLSFKERGQIMGNAETVEAKISDETFAMHLWSGNTMRAAIEADRPSNETFIGKQMAAVGL